MITKEQVLSNDFLICIKIFESNKNNEKIWFSKLVEEMQGKLSVSTVSKSLDRLFDRGMIDGDWEKVDGHWTRTLKITGEFSGFVEGLYNATEKCEE